MIISYYYSRFLKKLRGAAIKNSHIHVSSKIEAGTSFINSAMGRHSFCGYDCAILNAEIGSFCSIASNVKVGGVAHPVHFVSTSPVFLSHKDSVKSKFASHAYLPEIKTHIGSDVWIGDGAFIKAGVHIGTGAVIGMGAVVTKDVDSYAMVAGNPAKLIKKRFPNHIIEQLLASKWWELSDTDLAKVGMHVDKPEEFVRKVMSL